TTLVNDGVRWHAGDPNWAERNSIREKYEQMGQSYSLALINNRFDDDMIKAIANVNKTASSICFYGAEHLKPNCEGLEKKGIPVLAFRVVPEEVLDKINENVVAVGP